MIHSRKPRRHHPGFTVIELLTVLLVISLLAALIVPVVQQSREASRAVQCRHRLKQLGVALHGFHDTHEEFPDDAARMWKLLPFLEQTTS